MGHFIKIEMGAVSRIDNGGGVWYHFIYFSGCLQCMVLLKLRKYRTT